MKSLKTIKKPIFPIIILLTIIQFSFSLNAPIQDIDNEVRITDNSLNSFEKKVNQDINVYKDLCPDNYSFESTGIYNLAIINLERYYEKLKFTFVNEHFNISKITKKLILVRNAKFC